jgi:hypothetical protein
MLILSVTKRSNALKHYHVARWHRGFAVAHQRRDMCRNRECRRSLQLAPHRGEVSCSSHVGDEVADGGWVYDDERPALGGEKCARDGDDCGGWRIGSAGGDEEVGAGEARRRLIQPSGVGVLGDVNRFSPQVRGGWASFDRGAAGDQGGKDRG